MLLPRQGARGSCRKIDVKIENVNFGILLDGSDGGGVGTLHTRAMVCSFAYLPEKGGNNCVSWRKFRAEFYLSLALPKVGEASDNLRRA